MITRAPGNPGVLRIRRGGLRLQIEIRTIATGLLCVAVLLACTILGLRHGTIPLSLPEVAHALARTGATNRAIAVVWDVRLPRIAAGVIVGLALGAAGCVFQSLSRNALGSPEIIGFTTGAATGAVLQIIVVNKGAVATAVAAVAVGLLTAAAVYVLSLNRGASAGYRVVLVGIGVSAMLSAVNTMLLAKGNADLAMKARIWLSGSLTGATWDMIIPSAIGAGAVLPMLAWAARPLDIMEMGDDQALQLGVRVELTRRLVMLVGVVLTAVAVAVAGPISFIALAAPQIVRRLTAMARVQVVCSGLMGAALLVAADRVAQCLPVRIGIPVGVITGVVGGIYLLALIARQRSV